MKYQNLFEALQNVCGFTAIQSDMLELINAYEKDKAGQLNKSVCCKSCKTKEVITDGYCNVCGAMQTEA